jgi:hypothetical protein
VKNASHWRVFETVFEVYFSLRGPRVRPHRRAGQAMADLDELHGRDGRASEGEQRGGGGGAST